MAEKGSKKSPKLSQKNGHSSPIFTHSLHAATAPAIRAAVKTLLSYRNDTITALKLTKMKAMVKLLWLLLIFYLRIPGLI